MPTNELLDRLATNIRLLREQRGISRERLAATADVDAQMIKRIENARANPALVVLSRLASALMISLSLMLSADVIAEPVLLTENSESQPFESETVGETLVGLRKDRSMSRRALASRAHLRALTLSRYERATADARILSLEPIAHGLGIEPLDFVRAVELRQRQSDRAHTRWHSLAEGVRCRLASSGTHSEIWDWRLRPGVSYVDEPLMIVEEIATATRGEVSVEIGDEIHRLRRGGSVALPAGGPRRFTNGGRSTARVLRFQVTR